MTKHLLLLGALIVLSGCSQPRLGEGILNLEKVKTGFDVVDYYQGEIDKETKRQQQQKEIDQGIDITNLIDDKSIIDVKINKFYNDIFDHKEEDVYAIEYASETFFVPIVDAEYIAKYGPLSFYQVNMLTNQAKEFMGLLAINNYANKYQVADLIEYISKKNGPVKTKENDFFGSYTIYYWKNKDYFIAITTKIDRRRGDLVYVDEEKTILDTNKITYTHTNLFIIPNKHIETFSQLNRLNTGDWLLLRLDSENYF
ncbi:MAG: hypothetical protein LBI73_05135 [Myroides sp.]|jgi:hypothetical protein|nr:hypothetical protein [Myroides sp.]